MEEIETDKNVVRKTPEEIKKGIVEAIDEVSWVVEGGDAHDLQDACDKANASMADAIAYIQQLESKNKDLLEERELNDFLRDKVKKLEAQVPKWISVDDRLPDIDAEVLIYTDEGLYDVAQYSGGERFWTLERNPDCWVTASGVTHWMPLPEPPKETGKD